MEETLSGDRSLAHEPVLNPGVSANKSRGRLSTMWRIAKYLLLRAGAILLTIIVGVFITVLIANRQSWMYSVVEGQQIIARRGQIDISVENEAFALAKSEMPSSVHWWNMDPEKYQQYWQDLYSKAQEKLGLNLPFLPRHLLWTWRALRFDLGMDVRWILSTFQGTLFLVGPAFLLIFLLGIPLSLYLFRHHGSLLDRLFTFLAPISSIPSWVLGMLLVLIFAVGLHLLPPSGMFTPGYQGSGLLDLLKHMVLPVLAIFLSLFFQLLYTWKTFFLIYANEDYVELAKAKGLSNRELERKYIFRPSLNYILTHFALMLVGFWQITIALEYVFDWNGIGKLYIGSLPHVIEGNPVPGNMPLLVSVVVFFAWLLGLTMVVLDVVYALVDPRIRIGSEGQTVQGKIAKGRKLSMRLRWKGDQTYRHKPRETTVLAAITGPKQKVSFSDRLKTFSSAFVFLKPFFQELRRYPTAILGLVIILGLIIGSVVAVTAYPYYRIGRLWYETELTGKIYLPRMAKPAWINWFLKPPLPPSLILDSSEGQVQKTIDPDKKGAVEHTVLSYPIPFKYSGFPSDMTFYFSAHYAVRRPFINITWLTPDGRHLVLDNISPISNNFSYSFARDLVPERLLPGYPGWQNWFSIGAYNETYKTTPTFKLMFADPEAETGRVLEGNYTLQVDIYTYEPNSSVDAELVLLGQVWGPAGTDYLRRNLVVPLLWGMPFALALGLVGATLTTFLSMLLAAAGVYFGGWLDQLIQRIVEGMMILPAIAIGVIFIVNYQMSIWVFLALIGFLNVFGSPTKAFRAALLQIKDSPYIEWARASGAGNLRIIWHYFLPNILPLLVPQLVALIPTYVFLEATLGIFGVKSPYPTWGRIIYDALQHGAIFGSSYWVFEPIFFLLLTGLAFSMLGFALEKVLNPRLKNI